MTLKTHTPDNLPARDEAARQSRQIDRRRLLSILLLITLYFAVRIPALMRWSPTYDEPIYVGAGKHLLMVGDSRAAALLYHPPLSYHLTSLPLWFLDTPLHQWDDAGASSQVGLATLYDSHTLLGGDLAAGAVSPETVLLLSRIPVVLAGLLGMLFLAALARRLAGERGAFLAALAWALFPDAAAQSVQATTDLVAAVAALGLAVAFLRHHERVASARPSRGSLVVLGAACGLALLSKHTLLLHLATLFAFSSLLWLQRWRAQEPAERATVPRQLWRATRRLAAVIGVAAFVVWAGYGFEWHPLVPVRAGGLPVDQIARIGRATGLDPSTVTRLVSEVSLPAPSYFRSVADALFDKAQARDATLWTAYLNGEWSSRGFLSYFVVATLVKTPTTYLLALALGLGTLAYKRRGSVTTALCVVLFAFPFAGAVVARLNIGFRHLLPILPFLFAPAAAGLVVIWDDFATTGRRRAARVTAASALAVLLCVEWATSWQDPLAFANAPSGGPSALHRRLSDSNLEMGEDFGDVVAWAQREGIGSVHTMLHIPVELSEREAIRYPGLVVATSPPGGAIYDAATGAVPTGSLRGARVLAVGESVLVLPRFVRLVDVPPIAQIGRTRIYRLP